MAYGNFNVTSADPAVTTRFHVPHGTQWLMEPCFVLAVRIAGMGSSECHTRKSVAIGKLDKPYYVRYSTSLRVVTSLSSIQDISFLTSGHLLSERPYLDTQGFRIEDVVLL